MATALADTDGTDRLERYFPQCHIPCLEDDLLDRAQKRLDSLTKPPGSLGRLEELARRLFAIQKGRMPLVVSPALMLTVAGDHGVAAQNVSAFPQAVTRQMVMNFLQGGAAINALCRCAGMDMRVVDAGCCGGAFPAHPILSDLRIGDGTADFTEGPAMSQLQCRQAVQSGIELAHDAARQGYACLATGEMGIANSTAATALYCALLGFHPEEIAGPGAGAKPDMVQRKAHVVTKALRCNASVLETGDPLEILSAFGGFEIAVICGILLGAGSAGLPVLVDGFICSAAYAVALAMAPQLAGHVFLAHASAEPGHMPAMERLGQEPLLHLGMRLGEGTGAVLAWQLLQGAAAFFNDMSTFSEAGVCADAAHRIDL